MTLNSGFEDSGPQATALQHGLRASLRTSKGDGTRLKRCLLAALHGLLEHKDETALDRCLRGLAWLWRKTADPTLLATIGEATGKRPSKLRCSFGRCFTANEESVRQWAGLTAANTGRIKTGPPPS